MNTTMRTAPASMPSFDPDRPLLISHVLCPYVQRAVIALEEMDIAFQRLDIDLAAKPDWFRQLSPLGKTPLLLVRGQAIFESAVICEYLEDIHGPALHPADPLVRARHRAWMELASATLHLTGALYGARDAAGFRDAVQALTQRFAQIEEALGDVPYFRGKHFSLVDAAFGPVFRYFDLFDEVLPTDLFAQVPKVRAWRTALRNRPSIAAAVGNDYARQLRDFVIARGSVLGGRLAALEPLSSA